MMNQRMMMDTNSAPSTVPQKEVKKLGKHDIFKAILDRQTIAIDFHDQMADMSDFLGLRGYKRLHEYQYFVESAERRALKRYYINHHNQILLGSDSLMKPDVIPDDWIDYTRMDVNPDTRKAAVKANFEMYHEWEKETKDCYEDYAKMLLSQGFIADYNAVNELLKCVVKELKHLERMIITLSSMEWDMVYIESVQYEMHEHYRKKEESIGIHIR